MLLWGGIFGGALTIFGNLQAFMEMSHWARFIVTHWNDWTFAFWAYLANLTGHKPSHEAAAVLTFINSLILVSMSAMFLSPRDSSPARDNSGPWPWQWSDHYLFEWTCALASGTLALFFFNVAIELIVFRNSIFAITATISWIVWAMVGTVAAAWLLYAVSIGWRKIVPYIALAACISMFYFVIAYRSADLAAQAGTKEVEFYRKAVLEYNFAFFPLQMASFLTMAGVGYLLVRFAFIAAGAGILYAMNWISILDISLSAPQG